MNACMQLVLNIKERRQDGDRFYICSSIIKNYLFDISLINKQPSVFCQNAFSTACLVALRETA